MSERSKSNNYELSVCIPTYNRGSFIFETLMSMRGDYHDGVEILVYDGASQDDTESMVREAQKFLPNLVYYRAESNGGLDRDLASSVYMAKGKYCWLMSSDDLLEADAISIILGKLVSCADIYLCNTILCDKQMNRLRGTEYLSKDRIKDKYDLGNRSDLIYYLSQATSNNALFCYMSCLIFKKSRWNEQGFFEEFDGSGYAHVVSLFSFISSSCEIEYIPNQLVLNRSDNDSFSSEGIEKRYFIDFDGYFRIATFLFSDDYELKRLFLSVMTKEHKWYRLVKLRAFCSSKDSWDKMAQKLPEFGYSNLMLKTCSFLGSFVPLVKLMLLINRKFADSKLLIKFR